jgi:hypothetical protein
MKSRPAVAILHLRPSLSKDSAMSSPMLLPFMEWARKLRYPTLFKITAALFMLSALLPDPVPFVDEILFGLGTLLLANGKRRKDPVAATEPPALPRKR